MSLPNSITLFRIVLVPFFFTELISYQSGEELHRWYALAIFIVAAITDALDGTIARLTNHQTELGRFLDPLADKLLLLSGFLGLLLVPDLLLRPPLWVTVTIVFRDLMLVFGLISIFIVTGRIRVQPNWLGKTTTVAQMITLSVILLQWHYAFLFWNLTAVLTIASLISYLFRDLIKTKSL